jgi:hypothetical protein
LIFGLSAANSYPTLTLFGFLIGPWAALERIIENGNLVDIANGKAAKVGVQVASRRVVALVISVGLMPIFGIQNSMIVGLCFGSSLAFVVSHKPRVLTMQNAEQAPGATLRLALPYAISSWSNQLRNLDLPLSSGIVGYDAAYNLGLRVASPISIPFNSLGNLVLAKKVNRLRATSVINVAISLAVSVMLLVITASFGGAISLAVSHLIVWFTPGDVWILSLVIVRIVLAGCSSVQSSLLNSVGLAMTVSKINLATSIISLVGVGVFTFTFESIYALAMWPVVSLVVQVVVMQIMSPGKWNHGTN